METHKALLSRVGKAWCLLSPGEEMKEALRRGQDPAQQMCLEISEQEAQTTDSQLLRETVGH